MATFNRGDTEGSAGISMAQMKHGVDSPRRKNTTQRKDTEVEALMQPYGKQISVFNLVALLPRLQEEGRGSLTYLKSTDWKDLVKVAPRMMTPPATVQGPGVSP